jgi:hypothetical protein
MLMRSFAIGLCLAGAVACTNIADREVSERPGDGQNNGGNDGGRGNAGSAGSAAGNGGSPVALAGAGAAQPTAGAAGSSSNELAACSQQPSVMPLHALSKSEFRLSVKALTGIDVYDNVTDGSTGPGLFEAMVLDAPTVSALFFEVEHQRLVAKTPASPLPCDANLAVDATCVAELIDSFVAAAFRAPLSVAEKSRYTSLFKVATGDGDFAGATAMVIEAALLSPRFLLQGLSERSSSAAEERPLSPYELAGRLSFALTGTSPDFLLRKAVADNRLEGPAYTEQVERLLGARAHGDVAQHFFVRWLGLDELDSLTGPGLTPELLGSLRQETERFVSRFAVAEDSLANLLEVSDTFIDERLAPRYGLASPPFFMQTSVDPTRFVGILTQGSVLVRYTNPARRGRFVLNRLLCTEVAASPAGVDTNVVVAAGQTRRQAWQERLQETPTCQACHSLLDPIGFALEHFDELGVYQETENGLPIDASGSLVLDEAPVAVDGVVALASRIVGSQEWAECMARTWLGYVLERPLEASDDCTVRQIADSFSRSHQQRLTDLLRAVVNTHAFKYRDPVMLNDVPPPPLGNRSPTGDDLARKLFLLDFVVAETQWLSSEYPLEQRPLFDQYLSSLRELEQQLSRGVGPVQP